MLSLKVVSFNSSIGIINGCSLLGSICTLLFQFLNRYYKSIWWQWKKQENICFNSSIGIINLMVQKSILKSREFQFLNRYYKWYKTMGTWLKDEKFQFLNRYYKWQNGFRALSDIKSFNSSIGIINFDVLQDYLCKIAVSIPQ